MAATNSAINVAVANYGSFKSSCRVATTANITLSGTQTIDGVSVVAGDRVLVKNQTTGSQNGVYVVASGSWSRDIDVIVADTAFLIEEGTANADLIFILTTNNPITVGTTSLTWSAFSGPGATASGVSGSVQFSGGSGVFSSDGSTFFWDNTNKRLGIGTNAPGVDLEVRRTSGGAQITVRTNTDTAAIPAVAVIQDAGAALTLQAFGSTSSSPNTAVVRASSTMTGGLRLSSGSDTTGIKMFVSNGITVDTLAFTLAPSTFAATFVGALAASNFSGSSSGTNTGDLVMGSFNNVSNVNGATIGSQILTLRAADGTNPGGVSTTTQTFAGDKTFTGSINITKTTGNTLIVDTSTLVVDAANHRVGIGQATPGNALHMTGSIAGGATASLFDITGTGSSSSGITAMRVNMLAGYTGVGTTTAFLAVNTTAGTATSLSNNTFNGGARGQVNATTTGSNVGVFGTAANSSALNVGVYGQSFNAANSASNVAVLGQGLNTGTSSNQIGGYFLLSGPAGTDPGNYTSSALIADNGSTSSPVFLARVNGTARFTVDSSGNSTVTGGTLANDGSTSWLSLTGTMPTSPTAAINGINFNITSAGSAAQIQTAMSVTLAAGFTGARSTTGFSASNNAAGNVAQNLVGLTGNIGLEGQAHATVTTSTNWGVLGEAQNGAISVGVGAIAKTAKNSATNIAVLGLALNTGTSPIQIGGFFGLYGASDPTFASGALIADNGSTSSPVFLARVNGTAAFTIDSVGRRIIPTGGAAATAGTATLSGGTVTVSTTSIQAGSQVFLTHKGTGTTVNFGTLYKGTVTAGTSFVINSTNALDNDAVEWYFIN